MQYFDWIVLLCTISFIVLYGLWKSRGQKRLDNYLKSGGSLSWFTISLSVIATQASAITFLSAPGQAYTDGMRFVLFYLGLPIAMVVVSKVFIPIYYSLRVITAYEYLEKRFDVNTRVLTAFFFLLQRGLAAGISIAAPAIVLSVILEWDTFWINLMVGSTVIFYTVSGGSDAVSQTQKLQMIIILSGMALAGYLVIHMMPQEVSWGDAMRLAGKSGKFNTMDFQFDLSNRYNFWSGIIGGFFLQMAYFGTDQSQVGRYLGAKSTTQSKLGLLFNGMFKIPMQFCILYIGAMLFIFYQFNQPPIHFNQLEVKKLQNSEHAEDFQILEKQYQEAFEERKNQAYELIDRMKNGSPAEQAEAENAYDQSQEVFKAVREDTKKLMLVNDADSNVGDANYIFLTYVTQYLPHGLIGLLIAVILSASMSTTASELNALASTSTVDIYKRVISPDKSDHHYLWTSKVLTVTWGVIAIIFAQLATRMGTLIEAVNILGSLFYGTILGVFLLALFFKFVSSRATFLAALTGELVVVLIYFEMFGFQVAYLWLNLIGCLAVVIFGSVLSTVFPRTAQEIEKNRHLDSSI